MGIHFFRVRNSCEQVLKSGVYSRAASLSSELRRLFEGGVYSGTYLQRISVFMRCYGEILHEDKIFVAGIWVPEINVNNVVYQ